jgi:hypothetical protein
VTPHAPKKAVDILKQVSDKIRRKGARAKTNCLVIHGGKKVIQMDHQNKKCRHCIADFAREMPTKLSWDVSKE